MPAHFEPNASNVRCRAREGGWGAHRSVTSRTGRPDKPTRRATEPSRGGVPQNRQDRGKHACGQAVCTGQAALSRAIPFKARNDERLSEVIGAVGRVAIISAKNHKRQRRKRQSVTAKREKSQTPKVLTAILTLPNLTQPSLT